MGGVDWPVVPPVGIVQGFGLRDDPPDPAGEHPATCARESIRVGFGLGAKNTAARIPTSEG